MADFVDRRSIVRTIWGDADRVLLVFAGAAAEFALNRAVDWLFFTGALPRDPIGRLFSTAAVAQQIVFADEATAAAALARINAAHAAVEAARGQRIPDWAHRDVLYLLIAYSEAAHAHLVRALTDAERDDLYGVFRRVGVGLGIPDLPPTYAAWTVDRDRHLRRDLVRSAATDALYARYREHLGPWRYRLLRRVQGVLVPGHVRGLLGLAPAAWARIAVRLYPGLARAGLRPLVRRLLMPPRYLPAVLALDRPASRS